ncbi:MAG: GGDEF domain-containing protein [Coprococcus sp.]
MGIFENISVTGLVSNETSTMLRFIIQGNFINLCIAIYMFIFELTNRSLTKDKNRKFLYASILVIVLIVADSLDYCFSLSQNPTVFRYITSAIGYSIRPIAILFIISIAMKLNRGVKCFSGALLVINAVLAFGSIFTHCMFYFDDKNQFHRGIFGLFPFIVSGLYLAILTGGVIKNYRIGNRRESAIIILIMIMTAVGVCMESFLHYKFILDGVGNASIVFYYLFFNTQTYKRDAMTHIFNRHAFYNDVEIFSKNHMFVVSIDMNNLKKINDTKGHEEGDRAIITIARSISAQLLPDCYLYRMGGDEFALLCLKKDKKEVIDMIEHAQEDIAEYGYEIAWGLAEFEPGMDFEKVYGESDAIMYECKRKMKEGV